MFRCISFFKLPNTTHDSISTNFPITGLNSLRPIQQDFMKMYWMKFQKATFSPRLVKLIRGYVTGFLQFLAIAQPRIPAAPNVKRQY